jgi:hypothetical protein
MFLAINIGVKMNFNLKEKLLLAAKKTFDSLSTTKKNESFYAYVLYTDSSFMSISASANSEEKLKEIVSNQDDNSHAAYCYYRWSFSEWGYESWMAEEFKEVSSYLRNSPERENFEEFSSNVTEVMKLVLLELKKQRIFEKNKDDRVIAYASITDDDLSEQLEDESAFLLNSENLYKEFTHRYD